MAFDNKQKERNRKRPFHRVNSPIFSIERDINHLQELDAHLARQEARLDKLLVAMKKGLDGPLRPGDRKLAEAEFADVARQRAETTRRRGLTATQLAATKAVPADPPTGAKFLVADGRGYDCGCRAKQDFPVQSFISPKLLSPALGILRAIWDQIIERVAGDVVHTVPGWVPVARRKKGASGVAPPEDLQVEKEMEGDLIRSFQTWTDNPLTQFHIWYDWNFYVEPIPGYQFVKGFGNAAPHIPADNFKAGVHTVSTDSSVEGEWDLGALGFTPEGAGFPNHGPMFNNPNLWWPQAGGYVWLSGRWIYDCGHSDPPNDKEIGLMRSELHPVKAMATARWEAFKFKENGGVAVPAIQFMFVISKKGGYVEWGQKLGDPIWDLPPINAIDYEFIVDLPDIDAPPIGWSIGHTPDNPLNVGALRRPHLLKDLDFVAFNSLRGSRGEVAPIIEPIPQADPDKPPTQVRIKIPCTGLPAGADCFGVIISLGWFDPNRVQAARVKEVTVTLQKAQSGTIQHDKLAGPFVIFESLEKSEWQLRIGVNGRWIEAPVQKVSTNSPITTGIAGKSFTFFLDEQDAVLVSSHGVELDDVGDLMKDKTLDERRVIVNGVVARHQEDVVIPDDNPQKIHDTCRAIMDQMMTTFNIQNEPLGIIDPGKGQGADLKNNPFPVKDQVLTNKPFTLTAFHAMEVGELCELIVDPGDVDYTLHYTVSVKPQDLTASSAAPA